MKTIKFGNTSYNLVTDVVRESSRLRVTIYEDGHTLASVAEVVAAASDIQVLEDETVVAIYNGYTKPVALNLYTDYPVAYGEGVATVISITLENVDIQSQIDAITASLSTVEQTQATHDAAIADIGEELQSIEDTQETHDAAITDIGDTLEELTESQETQDLAIEDLAEAVSELTPEEKEE